MAIRYVILDFDGTCTQINAIESSFIEHYRIGFGVGRTEWEAALNAVCEASPKAGWTLANAPSAAPANADPYILTYEAAQRLLRADKKLKPPSNDLFGIAYAINAAPLRTELLEVLRAILAKGIHVAFVSNSDTGKVAAILDGLITDRGERELVKVFGNASKFLIGELSPELAIAPDLRRAFEALPPAIDVGIGRPVYLRRAKYFQTMCEAFAGFGLERSPAPDEVLVCGDIWELDLAMPSALGMNVHLVQRDAPAHRPNAFGTHAYERDRMAAGQLSPDLRGLLARI